MKGIYIHIPFCRKKCKYCDFVSYAGREDMADVYIEALAREAREYTGEKADTIFIGGGTPSALTPKQIRTVTKICSDIFDMTDNCEFTIEANPGTLDDDKITAMLEGGINRISVGVQSFNNEELRSIGRIHDAETAYNTVLHLKKAGFSNINIDLMTALPYQNIASLKSTLETAVSLPVSHISAYSLIIEEGTPLEKEYSRGELILPDDHADREMYAYTIDFLRQNGFFQYEISNFAKKGSECRHNIKYWTAEEYIGLGAAAHSYIGDRRFYNVSELSEYIKGALRQITLLTQRDKISEFMITGLRMTKGISAAEFKKRFGTDINNIFGGQLQKFTKLGLMKFHENSYRLTRRGIDVSNAVLCEFV